MDTEIWKGEGSNRRVGGRLMIGAVASCLRVFCGFGRSAVIVKSRPKFSTGVLYRVITPHDM